MAIFVNDTFTGTDDTVVTSHTGETGATWTFAPGNSATGANEPKIKSNALRGASANNSICYASGDPSSADYTVSGVFAFPGTDRPAIWGVAGRMSTSANTGYFAIGFAGEIRLYKYVAGSLTQIGSGDLLTAAADTYTLTLDMAGTTIAVRIQRSSDSQWLASGNTWQSEQVNCISETDSSISAAGKAGFWLSGDISVGFFTTFTVEGVGDIGGPMSATFGGLTATMTGGRTVHGAMAANLDTFTATLVGDITGSSGVLAATFGGLTATITGTVAAVAPALDEPLGTTGYPRTRSTTLGVFTIQQTDTHPLVACQLKQGVGTADEAVIDLTNADSVTFRMRALGATTDTVSAAATIVTAATGSVSYRLTALQTATAGRDAAWWVIDWADGNQSTVPSAGHDVIIIGDT